MDTRRHVSPSRHRVRRRVRSAFVLALVGVMFGGPAVASGDLEEIRQKLRQVERQESRTQESREAAQEKAAELDEKLQATSDALTRAEARLAETTSQVEAARIALSEAEADLADAEAEATRIQRDLGVARANEAKIEQRLADNAQQQESSRLTVGAIARESYKQGGMGSLATTLELLAGESDAVDQMSMARTVLRLQDQQIRQLATQEAEGVAEQDRLSGVRQDVAYLLARAEANVIAMDQAREAAEQAKVELEALEAQQEQARAALEEEKQKVAADLDTVQQESEDLSTRLAVLAEQRHGLKADEKAELKRLEEERKKREEEERRRKAAEEAARQAAAEEAARQRAAEREAERQRQAAAEAQRRADQQAAAEAERRRKQAEADARAAEERGAELRRQQEAASRQAAPRTPAPAPAPAPAPSPAPQPSGYLLRPTNGPVTSEFGNRFHPVLGIWRLHDGIDFGGACGTPVFAAADGVVFESAFNGGLGNYTVIDHGVHRGVNLTTSYGHFQSSASVSAGQSVSRGQVIGYVGTTGTSTGCHLHFTTRENGTPVNPRNWLGPL